MTTDTTTAASWLSIKDAADALGVDERTIRRRRDRGELEGRHRQDGGRRVAEVLVEIKPDKAAERAEVVASAITAAAERVERPAAAAITAYRERAEMAEALVAEVRASSCEEVRRVRASARTAWAAAAVLVVLASVGCIWGVRAITRAEMGSEVLAGRLAASEVALAVQAERADQADRMVLDATEDARRLSGQVSDLALELSAVRSELSEVEREANAARLAEFGRAVRSALVVDDPGVGVGILNP